MIHPYVMIWLAVGIILSELSLRHKGSTKLQPLAYLFIVTLWPVILPVALLLTIYLTIKKGIKK